MAKGNGIHIANNEYLEEADHLKRFYEALSKKKAFPTKLRKWKSLQEEVLRHSVEIELKGIKGAERKKELRQGVKNLKKAYEQGLKDFEETKGTFHGLSEDYLQTLARIIEPSNATGYRVTEARLKTKKGYSIPTSPEKIRREIDYFLFENSCIENPVEKALHSHFNIARIHPFGDGNGRLSRLVQNIILEKNGFVPILIKDSERKTYINLLSEGIESYNNRLAKMQDNPQYIRVAEFLKKPSIKLGELTYCKELCLNLIAHKMTPKKTDFYNFLLEREITELRDETYRILGNNH